MGKEDWCRLESEASTQNIKDTLLRSRQAGRKKAYGCRMGSGSDEDGGDVRQDDLLRTGHAGSTSNSSTTVS